MIVDRAGRGIPDGTTGVGKEDVDQGIPKWAEWMRQSLISTDAEVSDIGKQVAKIEERTEIISEMRDNIQEVRDTVLDMKSSKQAVDEYKEGVKTGRDHTINIIRVIAYLIFGIFTVTGILYTILNYPQAGGG